MRMNASIRMHGILGGGCAILLVLFSRIYLKRGFRMKRKLIYGVCVFALLAVCGCKTPEEKREEAARDRKLNERLDDIQQQLLNIQEKQATLAAMRAAPPPALHPVVPVKHSRPAARPKVTLKTRLSTLSKRHNLKPVSRKRNIVRKPKNRKKKSRLSLRRKHIKVGIPVRVIQQALANAGCSPGKIDGKVGPKTIEAILKFQKREGLNPDGVVGPVTWARLRNAGS